MGRRRCLKGIILYGSQVLSTNRCTLQTCSCWSLLLANVGVTTLFLVSLVFLVLKYHLQKHLPLCHCRAIKRIGKPLRLAAVQVEASASHCFFYIP